MLKKKERLTRSEFTKFFKTGSRTHSPHLSLIYSPGIELHGAVVVSKKVAKQAHERNTLRRRVYGQLYSKLKGNYTGVYIVLLKPPFASLTKNEQIESVQKLLSRITMSRTT